jgi:hypothetical protein
VTVFQSQKVIGRLPSSCGLLIPWGAPSGRLDYFCVVDGAQAANEGTVQFERRVSSLLYVVVAFRFRVEGCFWAPRGTFAATVARGGRGKRGRMKGTGSAAMVDWTRRRYDTGGTSQACQLWENRSTVSEGTWDWGTSILRSKICPVAPHVSR